MQIENVVAGLRFVPEKIVFIGFEQMMSKSKRKSLTDFFSSREENIDLQFVEVERYDYEDIVHTLNKILDENEDCCFDLTGGKELVVAAMGEVSSLRGTPMFQFNVRTGNFIRIKNCDNIIETEKTHLSLSEAVSINGCLITHREEDETEWRLSSDFRRDIGIMWDICRKNCGFWNYYTSFIAELEKNSNQDKSLFVSLDLSGIPEDSRAMMTDGRIIKALIKNFLILNYKNENNTISFSYKNEQIHACLKKAGNILELYAYMLLRELCAELPGHYDDIDIGVYIDWDGIVHEDGEKDTINEVDLMVMRDLVPIFISCKNGEVKKEALYELSVVADKFGGRYAKKILLTSYINSDKDSAEYLIRRARDMGIDVIDGVHKLTRQEFKATLKKRVK